MIKIARNLNNLKEWIDRLKKNEVHEVFYDYDFIVKFKLKEEDLLNIDRVKSVRIHYNC